MPDISAVIVNFNSKDFLRAAVDSVLAQVPAPREVIVVDNNSHDHSLARLTEGSPDPRVKIISLERNYGFAAGCNAGIRAASGEFVLLLNPDCRMFAGSLAALLDSLAAEPTAGVAGPRLINPDGSEQRGGRRDIPTPWLIFCHITRLYRLAPHHPRFRNFNQTDRPLPNAPAEVQAVSGACMLVRRRAIDRVGLLDSDRFFLHFEDLDWCMRFAEAGERILFVPDAVVEHTKGVCSANRPVRVEAYKHASLVRFLRKHFTRYYPTSFMLTVQVLVMCNALAAIGRTVFERLFRRPEVADGLIDQLAGIQASKSLDQAPPA